MRAVQFLCLSRKAILAAQRNCCWICGQLMRMDGNKGKWNRCISRDHIIPRSKLRERTCNNILYAHRQCNMRRGDTPLSDAQRIKAWQLFHAAIAYQLAA